MNNETTNKHTIKICDYYTKKVEKVLIPDMDEYWLNLAGYICEYICSNGEDDYDKLTKDIIEEYYFNGAIDDQDIQVPDCFINKLLEDYFWEIVATKGVVDEYSRAYSIVIAHFINKVESKKRGNK